MTINLIQPGHTGQTQRASFMAALSLAETLLSETTAIPTSLSIEATPWSASTPTIRAYFHHDPAAVRKFAEQFLLEVAVSAVSDRSVQTEASGRRDGVVVQAWALVRAEDEEMAA
ncbi:hypothetical protein ACFC34_00300 [Streptomyces sp. NPDC056053]|uniref:hypothetical protein n=1 Tax=Streptomyces sp. NPDC056053 TaxID=3345696 RepID=UPI0035E1DC77